MLNHEKWLKKAARNRNGAKKLCSRENLLDDEDDTLDIASYSSHQCAEKALKAFLIFKTQNTPKTHDLEKLIEICAKYDASFKTLLKDAAYLMPYGTYSRYPDDQFEIDEEEIKKVIDCATNILNFVKNRIKFLSHPNLPIFK